MVLYKLYTGGEGNWELAPSFRLWRRRPRIRNAVAMLSTSTSECCAVAHTFCGFGFYWSVLSVQCTVHGIVGVQHSAPTPEGIASRTCASAASIICKRRTIYSMTGWLWI